MSNSTTISLQALSAIQIFFGRLLDYNNDQYQLYNYETIS